MKVLYCGVFDNTGWGRASKDYALALDSVGVDVVCRRVNLNGQQVVYEPRLASLFKKSASGSDFNIQHVLPSMMAFHGHYKKNIGLFASETSNFTDSGWAERLNSLDEVWVINNQQVDACNVYRTSGVNRPIRVVPHATDITRFQRSYKPLEPVKLAGGGDFLFCTVGEMTRRKNLAALLKAFHLEFSPEEPVNLVIKTNKPGMGSEELFQNVQHFSEEIKRGLKLYSKNEFYKEEIVITEHLSDEDMLRLHASCDCFVQPSYGEAWSIPAFDAMAMGKTPIVTNCTGYRDYISDNEGWLVNNHEEPVFGVDAFADLYTGRENWASVDIGHLRKCMRAAFEDDNLRKKKAQAGIERAYSFSYETIGLQMVEALTKNEQTLDGIA